MTLDQLTFVRYTQAARATPWITITHSPNWARSFSAPRRSALPAPAVSRARSADPRRRRRFARRDNATQTASGVCSIIAPPMSGDEGQWPRRIPLSVS